MSNLSDTILTGCNSIPDFIGTGFLMLFQQTSAPTGWTKQTTHDNKALRVVTGNATPGGTVPFTDVLTDRTFGGTVGDTTLSTSQIPSHTHTAVSWINGVYDYTENQTPTPKNPFVGNSAPGAIDTGATGGGGSHSHPFITGNAVSFAVQYVDLIICSKN